MVSTPILESTEHAVNRCHLPVLYMLLLLLLFSHINSLTKESVVTQRCWSPIDRKIRKTNNRKFGCHKIHETKKAHTYILSAVVNVACFVLGGGGQLVVARLRIRCCNMLPCSTVRGV